MKFLIIGLGSMGKRRLRNLRKNGETDLVGFDLSPERRAEVEKAFNIPTIPSLLESPSEICDALIISTPPNLHAPYIRWALQHEKPFFVETTTSDEAYDEVLNAVASLDSIVRAPSSTFRHFEPIKRIKQMLNEKKVGTVLAYQYHLGQYLPDWHPWEDYRQVFFSKKETGACRELFPFELIWLNWLVGAAPEEVCGYVTKVSDLDMDADDLLSASLRHANGIYGNILIEVVARKPLRSLRFMCTDGVIEWDWIESEIRVYDAKSKETELIKIEKGSVEKGYMIVEEMYEEEIRAFLEALRGSTPYAFSFAEMRQNLNTLYALERAMRTKTYQSIT